LPERGIVEEDSVAQLMLTLYEPLYSYVGRVKGKVAYSVEGEALNSGRGTDVMAELSGRSGG